MRIGLIGYGVWGKAHAEAIKALQGAELAAIAVPSLESRQAAEADHGVPVYEDYRKMLDRSDLDVVDIVSPNYLHHEMALASLERGCDLLLEKPMAANAAECDEILTLAEAKGKLISIIHEYRVSPLFGGVRRLLTKEKIGDPLYLMFELWRRPFRDGASNWKQDPNRVLNWFLEEPIHYFDLIRWYFSDLGEPVRLYAKGSGKHGTDSPLNENMTALVDFPGGAFALFSQSLCGWGHSQVIKAGGTKGSVTASWSGSDARAANSHAIATWFDGTRTREIPIDAVVSQIDQLIRLIGDSLSAFKERRQPVVSGYDGRASVALCDAAVKSIRTGMPVDLTET